LKGYLKIISIRQGSEPYLHVVVRKLLVMTLIMMMMLLMMVVVVVVMMMATTRSFQRIRTGISKVQSNSDET